MRTTGLSIFRVHGDMNDRRRKLIEDRGRAKFFRLRDIWSWFIIGWICVLIAFNIAVTFLIGRGTLDYSEYEWFITAVSVQTFLQVVGLGAIAVRHLFRDG